MRITTKGLTPMRAIRAHCIVCSGGNRKEVRLCPLTHCPLYQYRLGKNLKRKGIGGSFTRLKTEENDG